MSSSPISTVVDSIPEALSIYVNQMVYAQKEKGMDITTLSLGEAFFDIPMFDFGKLDFVKGYHYSDSKGIPPLRRVIATYYKKMYNTPVNPDTELLISTGSKPILFFIMKALANPGDEVVMHDPYWLSYTEQARLVGAIPKTIPYTAQISEFENYFTEKTKLLVLNNPNNPAGRVYTKEELQTLYTKCRARGIYLMIDEAYSDFVDQNEFHSIASLIPDKKGVIVVNSLSKNMGMSGWRVGYVIAEPLIINAILKLNQHIITCAPTILQYYMAEYFDDVIAITLPQVAAIVEKRKRVEKMMNALNLKYMPGVATFYFLVNIGDFPGTGLEYAYYMLFKHQVSVVPGKAYGESCSRYVRVSIGVESEERIYNALRCMADLNNIKKIDRAYTYDALEKYGFHKFENSNNE